MAKMGQKMPQVIFAHLDHGDQEELGDPGLSIYCTQCVHAIASSLSHLGQVLQSCRAFKEKKTNFSRFSKKQKERFLQSVKVNRVSATQRDLINPN